MLYLSARTLMFCSKTSAALLLVLSALRRKVQTVLDAPMPAGVHRAQFDGAGLASGVYVLRAVFTSESGRQVFTERVTLVR